MGTNKIWVGSCRTPRSFCLPPGKSCAIARAKATHDRSDPPQDPVSGGLLDMRDCGKCPGRIIRIQPSHVINTDFLDSAPAGK